MSDEPAEAPPEAPPEPQEVAEAPPEAPPAAPPEAPPAEKPKPEEPQPVEAKPEEPPPEPQEQKEEPKAEEAPAAEEAKPVEEPKPAEEAKPAEDENPKEAEPEGEAAAKAEEVTEQPSEEPKAEEEVQEAKPSESTASAKAASKEPSLEKAEKTDSKTDQEAEKETSKTSLPGKVVEEKGSSFISAGSLEHKKSRQLSRDEGFRERKDRFTGKAQKVLGSVYSIHRLSATSGMYHMKGARFMNSYKLDSDNPFNPEKVQKILESVMVEALENLTYDTDKCPKQAKWASNTIRQKVKELQFDRYKLICLVTIGEKNSQDIYITCRFLWDVDRDRYATYSMENSHVFGVAQCFGVYYE